MASLPPTLSLTHTQPSPSWMGAPGIKRDRDGFAGAPRMTKASRNIPRPMLRSAEAANLGCTVQLQPKHQISTNAKELISGSDHQSTLHQDTPIKFWIAQCRQARRYRDQNDLQSFELELLDVHDRWDPETVMYNEAQTLPDRRAASQRAEDAQYWLNHCWTRLLAADREQAERENKRSLEDALIVASALRPVPGGDSLMPARHHLSEAQDLEQQQAASNPPSPAWARCNHWKTGNFNGMPKLSQQTFEYVYTHAPTKLLTWVWDEGRGAHTRWLREFAAYIRMRSNAEGRHIPHFVPNPNWTGD